ncbi:4'-phosphopantetheinyl transferase [Rhodovulum iodosum]|uniref:4'-phosphopantetheinyl transferase n=1 Tax=Rhodovulum iodosum TaxID=68291 RepID=A0ABV3XWG1_9RHOB|nr:4'-phosphopantetheinyl transferase superfamily protein [Rhodovulum robiginosum]RSK38358.1 4'-phosphopantetheinyl transferase superfamily protein [Rhodovulum robiginosum]
MPVEIDLWLWALDPPPDLAARLAKRLAPEEQARAARFVHPRHGSRFSAARGRMREILAGYVGGAPEALRFHYNPQGKPGLEAGPAFNLSHAGGWAALAVTQAQVALGIDIEAVRQVDPAVADRFFSPDERAELSRFAPGDWATGFFRCWTRKEAVVKACGPGLSMPLDSFDVTLGETAAVRRIDGGAAEDWALLPLTLGPGLFGAVAVENHRRPVRLRWCEGRRPVAPLG